MSWSTVKIKCKKQTCIVKMPTNTFGLCGVGDKSLGTPAAVASHCVLTAAILTDPWLGCTLV